MCRPPAAALGQDAGGQGRGEGRGGHRRRDTLDRAWHYKGFASLAWTLQGKQHTQKVPSPRASVSPSENEVYPSGSEDPGSGPRLAPRNPGDVRRPRGGCARPLEATGGGAGRGCAGQNLCARGALGREPSRPCGGRCGHLFHGYATLRLGIYSEHVHTLGENGTELM